MLIGIIATKGKLHYMYPITFRQFVKYVNYFEINDKWYILFKAIFKNEDMFI